MKEEQKEEKEIGWYCSIRDTRDRTYFLEPRMLGFLMREVITVSTGKAMIVQWLFNDCSIIKSHVILKRRKQYLHIIWAFGKKGEMSKKTDGRNDRLFKCYLDSVQGNNESLRRRDFLSRRERADHQFRVRKKQNWLSSGVWRGKTWCSLTAT